MKVKNLVVLISCTLISAAAISYCLAQSQHRVSSVGATTLRIRPYDPARAARDQKYDLFVEQGDRIRTTNPAAAEVYYRKATAVNPQPSDAWMGLARATDEQGKQAQALSAYQKVFSPTSGSTVYSTFPSDVEALARYGTLCENAGLHDAAIQACNQASERLNPKPKIALDVPSERQITSSELRAILEAVRGVALDQQGKKGEAVAAFSQAAALQPDNARIQFYQGYGYQKAGQYAPEQTAFQKATLLDTQGTVKAAAAESLRAVQAHLR